MDAFRLCTIVVLATAASMGCGGRTGDLWARDDEPDASSEPARDASAPAVFEGGVDSEAAAMPASDGSVQPDSGIAWHDGEVAIDATSAAGDVDIPDASPCGSPGCPGPCVALDSDPHNCGACAHDCLGGVCASGACQPFTIFTPNDSSEEADWIAVDATNVYWTGFVAKAVMSAPIRGGSPDLLTTADGNSHSIAINAQNVYWGDGIAEAVMAVRIGGGAASTIASAQQAPYGVAADGTSVYWTDQEASAVRKAPANGGSVETLASGLPGPAAIAVDATSVYFTTFAGSVMKVGLDGGSPVTLASGLGQGVLPGMAVDAQNVYWTAPTTATVMKVSTGGGTAFTMASAQVSPGGIAVDSSGVYWVTAGDGSTGFNGTVMKVGLDGGDPVTLASGQPYPSGVALDVVSVYWADGNVMRLAK
jgi:sugar lactone lactonase YvrE